MSERWNQLSTPGNANPNIAELNFECVSATAILVDQNLLILTSLIDNKIQKYTWDSGLGPQQKNKHAHPGMSQRD